MSSSVRLGFLLCLLSVCLSCQRDSSAPKIYRDNSEYLAALKHVQEHTMEPFNAVHEGQPISDREIKDLNEALKTIESLIAYKPDNYGPYILKGLTLRALDRDEEGLKSFEQGLLLAPKELSTDDEAAVARIHAEMASLFFDRNDPDPKKRASDMAEAEKQIDLALSLLPSDPTVLTDAASIKLELKKTEEAKRLLTEALSSDPANARAKALKKLIDLGSK